MKAGKTRSGHPEKLDAASRDALPDSAFGIPELREFPIPDAAHVRAAESYFRYAPENKKALLAHRILLKAGEFGVEVKSPVIFEWVERYKG